MIKRILLDMDEVLVDFERGACKEFGVDYDRFQEVRQPGTWEMLDALSQLLKRPIDLAEFWAVIDLGGAKFWTELQETRHAKTVEMLALQFCDEPFHLISSPSYHPASYDGKVHWIKRNYGWTFNRFALTPHKEIFAQPGVVLIDDRPENVRKFTAAGGHGILFPTRGNCLYDLANDPVKYVEEQLTLLKKGE